jgi:hypothetical protein
MESREELVIVALQEKIGQMAANYELQIALLRAELTKITNDEMEKEKAIESYSKEIESKLEEI